MQQHAAAQVHTFLTPTESAHVQITISIMLLIIVVCAMPHIK